MPNEYDSLLAEPPVDQKSPYDALLPATTTETPFVKAERAPFAVPIAKAIDYVAGKLTGGRAGGLEELVTGSTREPAPGETSFTNLGIPTVPQQETTGRQIAAGVANVPINAANFLLSPGGALGAEGLAVAPKAVRTLTGALFGGEQALEAGRAPTLQGQITAAGGAALIGVGTLTDALFVKPPTPRNIFAGVEPITPDRPANWRAIQMSTPGAVIPEEPQITDPFHIANLKQPTLTESLFGKSETEAPLTETTAAEPIATETAAKEVPNATQERQITESRQPEYTRDVKSGTPTETGGRGGVEPAAPVVGTQEPVEPIVPQPEQPQIATPTAETPVTMGKTTQRGQITPTIERGWTGENAIPVAESVGGKVVGSVANKGKSAHDLDLTVDTYDHASTADTLAAQGFEWNGSNLVSPKEGKASGQAYGSGWQREEYYENKQTGQKIGVWHEVTPENDTEALHQFKVNYEPKAPSVSGAVTPIQPKEVTPTAETPITTGVVTPEGQVAPKEPQSITSIKNEQVDTERATRGLPPVVEPARKAFGESWEQATQKIDQNPSYPDQLIDELRAKPRALNDVEDAALLHRQVDLQNQYQKSADLLIKARESGDQVGAMEHDARVNALSDQLLDLYDVGKKAGTETGRGLAARQLLAQEDFSIANMVTQKRAANQGQPLTPEQTEHVNTSANKISAAQTAYDAYETSPKAEAYKKRLQTLTEQYKQRTAAGDFTPRQRTLIELDKEGQQLKANLERAKKDWLTALQKDRAANRTPSQKFWDRFVGVERAMKLSSDVVLAKLTTAAVVREAGLTPAEEIVGGGVSKILPGLAKRAPREGGFSPAAEIKAKAEMFTNGMKDAWNNLKMKQSDLDTLYSGKRPPPPSEFYDYLGYLHGALKAPIKRAEFARSLTKRMEWAVKNGQDLNNVNTMRALSEEAYVDANRSIFQQDNVVASTFSSALNIAAQGKKFPDLGPAVSRIGKFLVPIVKVPTNIVGEVATGVHGTAVGGARAAVAYLKGIDTLPTAQADSIMRQLKKGLIGNALILTGYYTAENIGGFYHDKDKRSPQDVQPGRYRVGDVDIPASAGHSTGAMLLNIGATVKRVQDERVKKSEPGTKGLTEGVRAAGAGLAHEIPFIPAFTGITDALGTQNGLEKYVYGMIQSTTVPALSSHIAKILDTPGSLPSNLLQEPIKRRPTNPIEAFKMGIPGKYGRESVPERPERGAKVHKRSQTGVDITPLNP